MATTFTPEQIAQILEEFFNTVGTRQYIGARYVPIFGRKDEDTIEWDNTGTYEPLTIVLYQGNSYTSRQYVPVGVEITNQEFWALTGNYNAQVEQYRRETAAARAAAEAAQNDIDTLLPKDDFSATNTVSKAIADGDDAVKRIIDTLLPKDDFSATNTVSKAIADGDDAVKRIIGPRFSESNTIAQFADAVDLAMQELETGLTEIIMFGDSWADKRIAVNTSYVNELEAALNCTMHDYAISGAGFVKPESNLISSQVSAFLASDVDKSKVKYCVFVGGVNDQHLNNVGSSALATAIRTQVERIRNACPQCKILYVTDFAYPYTQAESAYWRQLIGYLQTGRDFGILNTYGLFSPNLMNNANWYHLTEVGYRVYGQMIYSALTGAPINPSLAMEGSITSQDGNCKLQYNVNPKNSGCDAILTVTYQNQTVGQPISARFATTEVSEKIPWISQNSDAYYPSIGAQYALAILDIQSPAISFACQSAPAASGAFNFTVSR